VQHRSSQCQNHRFGTDRRALDGEIRRFVAHLRAQPPQLIPDYRRRAGWLPWTLENLGDNAGGLSEHQAALWWLDQQTVTGCPMLCHVLCASRSPDCWTQLAVFIFWAQFCRRFRAEAALLWRRTALVPLGDRDPCMTRDPARPDYWAGMGKWP